VIPLISQQKLNVSIKKSSLAADLTRPGVVLNPTTSEEEIRPLHEIASSVWPADASSGICINR